MHNERLTTGSAGGAYSAPPDLLAGFKRAALRLDKQGREGMEGTKGDEGPSPYHQFLDPPLTWR